MGREIRRVPKDWVHPSEEMHPTEMDNFYDRHHKRGEFGYGRKFHPLYDDDFENRAIEWLEGWELWKQGKHEDQVKYPSSLKGTTFREYCEFQGRSPNPEYYRERAWTEEEATCYQIYETVSEGTPVSPVFETLDQMVEWMIADGTSPGAARAFAKEWWVPSGMGGPSGYAANYDTLVYPTEGEGGK